MRHDTDMRADNNFADSHGQSEVVFALCRLLGSIRLMRRLNRIKYERSYLTEKRTVGEFLQLAAIVARPIRWDLIERQYDEVVKAAIHLKRCTAAHIVYGFVHATTMIVNMSKALPK